MSEEHLENFSATDRTVQDDYMVVARRYRPQTFSELIGQEHVAEALEAAITAGRVGHAYLFTGARGVGKTSAARILAKALDCVEGPTTTPCNTCEICQGASDGDDVDILEIDGASNRGIDEIRQLRSNVNIRPSRARFKIYVIDEVHMLTREAFNALLKTLEEPPEHVKFIFCTTEPNKIPITVLSRCQRFDFAGIDSAAIGRRLRQIADLEGTLIDDDALELLARRAAGSMRDGQSLLEQLLAFTSASITAETVHRMLGTAESTRLLAIAGRFADQDAAGVLADLDQAIREGVDVGQLLDQLLGVFRDCMVSLAGCDADSFQHTTTAEEADAVRQIAGQLGLETVLAILQILQQAQANMQYSTAQRTLAELALVRGCRLEGLEQISSLIARLDGEENHLSPGTPGRSPDPHKGPKKKSSSGHLQPRGKRESASEPSVAPQRQKQSGGTPSPEPEPLLQAAASGNPPKNPGELGLTAANAGQVWQQAQAKLSGVVLANTHEHQSVEAPTAHKLRVTFSEKYSICKSICEQAEHARKIEQAVASVTGTLVRVEYVIAESDSGQEKETLPRPASRQEKMAAIAENPLVRRAQKLFGARPTSID